MGSLGGPYYKKITKLYSHRFSCEAREEPTDFPDVTHVFLYMGEKGEYLNDVSSYTDTFLTVETTFTHSSVGRISSAGLGASECSIEVETIQ